MSSESPNKTKKALAKWLDRNRLVAVIIAAAVGVLAAYLIIQAQDNTEKDTDKPTNQQVSLSLDPASKKLAAGDTLSVGVWADSGRQPVNSVQVNLSYPTDSLEFVSVDSAGSAFAMGVQAEGGKGKVAIAKGSTSQLNGNLLVANITFRVKAKSGKAEVKFDSDSMLVNGKTFKNIVQKMNSGSYTIE